jgi:hypothetical protein
VALPLTLKFIFLKAKRRKFRKIQIFHHAKISKNSILVDFLKIKRGNEILLKKVFM